VKPKLAKIKMNKGRDITTKRTWLNLTRTVRGIDPFLFADRIDTIEALSDASILPFHG
jgi:hypothetical protein